MSEAICQAVVAGVLDYVAAWNEPNVARVCKSSSAAGRKMRATSIRMWNFGGGQRSAIHCRAFAPDIWR
jgi:hypothetical protein